MIFTFIPLMLMAGAAYLHSRTLFGDQVSAQMGNQLAAELNQLNLAIKAKQTLLDNLIRQPDFDSKLDFAISADPHSDNFSTLRNNLSQQMRSPTPQAGNATFNQFFLMLPNGMAWIPARSSGRCGPTMNCALVQRRTLVSKIPSGS